MRHVIAVRSTIRPDGQQSLFALHDVQLSLAAARVLAVVTRDHGCDKLGIVLIPEIMHNCDQDMRAIEGRWLSIDVAAHLILGLLITIEKGGISDKLIETVTDFLCGNIGDWAVSGSTGVEILSLIAGEYLLRPLRKLHQRLR